MTVRLVTTVQNYIGLSTDTKPTSVKPGSTFRAYDTGVVYTTYDGTNWEVFSADSIVLAGTVDLHNAAATYDLFTATGGSVSVEKFSLTLPNIDCSDDAALTGITVQTDTATVVTIIASAAGLKANLTANAAFSYNTPFVLPVGKKIQLTIVGGTATADPTTCVTSCRYRAISAAGYLA